MVEHGNVDITCIFAMENCGVYMRAANPRRIDITFHEEHNYIHSQ